MQEESPAKKEGLPAARRLWRIELGARVVLALFAAAALVLAAVEDHEAIGTALVGAAIAFALGAAFFDRVVEVSTRGVKLRDLRAMEEALARQAPQADPEEKEELVEEGSEILATKRSRGERITPDQAVGEAALAYQRNAFAVEQRFALWLVERGWTPKQPERFVAVGQPDLVAERNGRYLAIEVKTGRRPVSVDAVRQTLANAAAVEATLDEPDRSSVRPVLVLGEVSLTRLALESAETTKVTAYHLDADNNFTHIAGPELD
jgi:hypothetical protein